MTGENIRLADYRGKTVLLEFFTTWCPHCQAEMKHLINLMSRLPALSFAFLLVNADGEDTASIYAFDRYFRSPYPTLVDSSSRPGSFKYRGGPGPVSMAYKIRHFPTFYVVDRNGKIVWRNYGEQPDALLESEMRATQ